MAYHIENDIPLICDLLSITQEQLAHELGVSRATVNRWQQCTCAPSDKHIETLYNFAYKKGISLNEIKAQLLAEEASSRGFHALFHGSKSGILGEISTDKSRANNDFGSGFYCGESFEQASTFVCNFPRSNVYSLTFNPANLAVKQFQVDAEWMLAISCFRGFLSDYDNHPTIATIKQDVERADYIVAPIADNRIFRLIDEFAQGLSTDIQCKHALSATSLGNQYVFKTAKAIAQLHMVDSHWLSAAERSRLESKRIERSRTGQDKAKVAKRLYRNEGLYIEELLS